ncbi:unnamed protein product [Gordionus sp. m RMFG-2023]
MYDSNWNMAPSTRTNSWTSYPRFYKKHVWNKVKNAFDFRKNIVYDRKKNDNSLKGSSSESLKSFDDTGGVTWIESHSILNQVLSPQLIQACLHSTSSHNEFHISNSNPYIKLNAQYASNFLWRHFRNNSGEPYSGIFYKMIARKFPVIDLPNFQYKIDISYPECEDKEYLNYLDCPQNNKDTHIIPILTRASNSVEIKGTQNLLSNNRLAKMIAFLSNEIQTSNSKAAVDSSTSNNSAKTQSVRFKVKKKTKPINLIVLIHTAPSNFENRMSIRKSWGSVNYINKLKNKEPAKPSPYLANGEYKGRLIDSIYKTLRGEMKFEEMNIRLVFLTALNAMEVKEEERLFNMRMTSLKPFPVSHNSSTIARTSRTTEPRFNFTTYQQSTSFTQKRLKIEARKYRDIVQGNFVDSYQNLTYKMIMGFKWIVSRCPKADYILKIDDDVYVDIFKLYILINKATHLKNVYDDYEQNLKTTPLDVTDINLLLNRLFLNSLSSNTTVTKTDMISSVQKEDKEWISDLLTSFTIPKRTLPVDKNSHYDKVSLLNNNTFAQSICKGLAAAYETLDTNPFTNMLLCNVWTEMPVLRDQSSKWYMSESDYVNNTYPPYCSGGAILLPTNVAYKLMFNAPNLKYFWIDDIHITGSLMAYSKLSLKRLNSRFTFEPFPTKNDQDISTWLNANSEESFYEQLGTNKYIFGLLYNSNNIQKLWNQTFNFYMDYFMII